MRILFVHQNFPGQYLHVLRHLAAERAHEIVFLTKNANAGCPGIRKIVYRTHREMGQSTHHYLRTSESAVLHGQAVARAALMLKKQGFVPDILIGHNGWGETLYLKDVFPEAPLLSYFEFFYRAAGSDVGFDPEFPADLDARLRVRMQNAVNLIGLEAADRGQCPTAWQKAQYPGRYHDMISVVHEGIDTDLLKPDDKAQLALSGGLMLARADEVVTYVARNLEPYRGFHVFMRALPGILRKRPKAHVLIVGGDEVSYGHPLPNGQTYRDKMLKEVGSQLDPKRVHFLGKVPYPVFLKVLQVSSAHVYLTYPFVLSWSMLEAMSAGCLVVGSATPPVAEVISHRENGLLVEFFSTAQITEAVEEALADRRRMQEIRDSARRTVVERFDLKKKCLPAQLNLIEDLIGGSSTHKANSEPARPLNDRAGTQETLLNTVVRPADQVHETRSC